MLFITTTVSIGTVAVVDTDLCINEKPMAVWVFVHHKVILTMITMTKMMVVGGIDCNQVVDSGQNDERKGGELHGWEKEREGLKSRR